MTIQVTIQVTIPWFVSIQGGALTGWEQQPENFDVGPSERNGSPCCMCGRMPLSQAGEGGRAGHGQTPKTTLGVESESPIIVHPVQRALSHSAAEQAVPSLRTASHKPIPQAIHPESPWTLTRPQAVCSGSAKLAAQVVSWSVSTGQSLHPASPLIPCDGVVIIPGHRRSPLATPRSYDA